MQGKLEDVVRLFAVALALAICAGLPPSAVAAPPTPEPGVPVPVAPGVPGHGRAWELTTPPDPIAATVNNLAGIAPSGDGVVYGTVGPPPDSQHGVFLFGESGALRGLGGWVNEPLEVPIADSGGFFGNEVIAFTPDLATTLWNASLPPEPGQTARRQSVVRVGPDGRVETIAATTGGVVFGVSDDLRRIWFSSEAHLLPSDAGRVEGESLYEISDAGLSQVDVGSFGLPVSTCGSGVPGYDSISPDRRRVFFLSPDPETSCPEPTRVYMREGSATTEVSVSHCSRPDCNASEDVRFLGQTSAHAYLVTREQLTDDDTDEIDDLYRYRFADAALERVSAPRPATGTYPQGARGDQVWGSPDDSRLYFVFQGRFFPEIGQEGSDNIYLADASGIRLVVEGSPNLQISADGRYAFFETGGQLDPADADAEIDVYRFDAVDGSYERVSAAGPGSGNGEFKAGLPFPLYVGNINSSTPLLSVSEDGSRVFFETAEPLLPADRNDLEDAYEWSEGGGLSLVSAGAPSSPGDLFASSPDGGSVFFRTPATLVPQDRDGGEADIYAARLGGGFPLAVAALGCEGPDCRTAPAQPASRQTPASAGPGRAALAVAPIDAAARRRMVASGAIELLVEASAPGRLSLRAKATLGKRARTVASTAEPLAAPATVRLRAPLSRDARAALARGAKLRVRLTLRQAGLPRAKALRFSLRGSR
jgi:hypothetical protein